MEITICELRGRNATVTVDENIEKYKVCLRKRRPHRLKIQHCKPFILTSFWRNAYKQLCKCTPNIFIAILLHRLMLEQIREKYSRMHLTCFEGTQFILVEFEGPVQQPKYSIGFRRSTSRTLLSMGIT